MKDREDGDFTWSNGLRTCSPSVQIIPSAPYINKDLSFPGRSFFSLPQLLAALPGQQPVQRYAGIVMATDQQFSRRAVGMRRPGDA